MNILKQKQKKVISIGKSYFIYLFFLGWLGADRLYVGKIVSGYIKLILFLFAFILYISPLYSAPVVSVLLLWWLLDLICIIRGEFAGFQRKSEYH